MTYNSTSADQLALELSEEYGVKVGSYKMPAEDSAAIESTVQLVTKEMGEIDVIIANAGICIHNNAEVSTSA